MDFFFLLTSEISSNLSTIFVKHWKIFFTKNVIIFGSESIIAYSPRNEEPLGSSLIAATRSFNLKGFASPIIYYLKIKFENK